MKQHADIDLGDKRVVLVMAEFALLQSSQGVWDGQHRVWASPTARCERSSSQALVLASTSQAAVMIAMRWRTRGDAFDAVLMLRSTSDSYRFAGRLCGTHPLLPATLTLCGDATDRHGIVLHGEEHGRPWEVTVGRSSHEIAFTVYDGAGCRPELPVMHAGYPVKVQSLPLAAAYPARSATTPT